MSKELAIKVENISKLYRLGKIGTGSFIEDIQRFWAKFQGKEDPLLKVAIENKRDIKGAQNVWALRDISFELEKGEILGIVGRNGAGKSTLLKVLSGITSPTTGCIKIKGRVASLLEVGTGFHPELTGRENIYLNGAILGMNKREMDDKFEEIVDFSGVVNYLDTPVKRYSSGMRVRLGFAVAAHLEPEILVVDEVLAVGDAEFQKKAIGKMKEVSTKGDRTVLFVSHNLASLRKLCTKGLLLENGKQTFFGNIEDAIQKYNESGLYSAQISQSRIEWNDNFPGNDEINVLMVELRKKSSNELTAFFSSNDVIQIRVEIRILKPIRNFRLNLQILTQQDDVIFTSSSHSIEPGLKESNIYTYNIELPSVFFNKISYKVRLISDVNRQRVILYPMDVISFTITDSMVLPTHTLDFLPGLTNPEIKWDFETK